MSDLGARPVMGMSMRFNVTVGGVSLGDWASCAGLKVMAKLHKAHDPGQYGYQRIMFADVDYQAIKLKRAIDSSSAQVLSWLRGKWSPYGQPGALHPAVSGFLGDDATIQLLDSEWRVVTSWELRNVYPVSWTGPDLDADKAGVAKETLELAHEGFL
ncbi:conserved hypothetical phage tail region protein [Lentzea fradiae]|uniref:Conserved hypothetical phage tail region protein n=1 Tax=Lentzea fradiae TaxID=200378 RepID=A0A1G7L977_9PSEU|nr:phage tail protein [Lentzea fradiae]SDF45600.1 conserved hypothetical phage tail region protein [Lentzea fradiae]